MTLLRPLFQNSDFIVLDKPSGVLSTPSRDMEKDQRVVLGLELQKSLGRQIFPVHRLDFEVSGLVIYALSAKAHSEANSWFEKKMISKTYRAWTLSQSFAHIPGNVDNPKLSFEPIQEKTYQWHSKILKGKKRAYVSEQGKESHTLAKFLGSGPQQDAVDVQLSKEWAFKSMGESEELLSAFNEKGKRWDLQPVTGRSHQLRFELSYRGFPILGDKLYGSSLSFPHSSAIALRAWKIDFSGIPAERRWGLPKVLTTHQEIEW